MDDDHDEEHPEQQVEEERSHSRSPGCLERSAGQDAYQPAQRPPQECDHVVRLRYWPAEPPGPPDWSQQERDSKRYQHPQRRDVQVDTCIGSPDPDQSAFLDGSLKPAAACRQASTMAKARAQTRGMASCTRGCIAPPTVISSAVSTASTVTSSGAPRSSARASWSTSSNPT